MSVQTFRQGDILLESFDGPVEGAKALPREGTRIILARGEATGHAHAVCEQDVAFVQLADGRVVLMAQSDFQVRHEEHAWLDVPQGNWIVKGQVQYTPKAIERIAD